MIAETAKIGGAVERWKRPIAPHHTHADRSRDRMADAHSSASTIPTEKRCTTCDRTQPADQFWKNTHSHDGLAWICKACGKIANKAYKSTHVKLGPHRKRGGFKVKHGLTGSPLHRRWKNMKNRCGNPKCSNFHRYGGRGIAVCPEWAESFAAFCEWAMSHGYRRDLQIDRINNDGPYSPGNCRWVTPRENVLNSTGVSLSPADVDEIRRLVVDGSLLVGNHGRARGRVSTAELAVRFGVGIETIRRCAAGRTYQPYTTDEVSR